MLVCYGMVGVLGIVVFSYLVWIWGVWGCWCLVSKYVVCGGWCWVEVVVKFFIVCGVISMVISIWCVVYFVWEQIEIVLGKQFGLLVVYQVWVDGKLVLL